MGGWVGRWVAWWVAGKCETITNSASAEAGVEALAELGSRTRGGGAVPSSASKDTIFGSNEAIFFWGLNY